MKKTISDKVLIILIIFGISISVYLLIHHLKLTSGQLEVKDLCYAVFGKGCTNALISPFSNILGIPLGGWGLIYFGIIGIFYFFSLWLSDDIKSESLQAAFWVSFIGVFFSLFYILLMIRYPLLFCPFCTLFHLINFITFIFLFKKTELTPGKLINNLWTVIKFVLLAKPLAKPIARWKWIPFLL
jgi:uncharacterized membrane protein